MKTLVVLFAITSMSFGVFAKDKDEENIFNGYEEICSRFDKTSRQRLTVAYKCISKCSRDNRYSGNANFEYNLFINEKLTDVQTSKDDSPTFSNGLRVYEVSNKIYLVNDQNFKLRLLCAGDYGPEVDLDRILNDNNL